MKRAKARINNLRIKTSLVIPTRQLPGLGELDEIAPQQSWHMEPIISQPADSILHLLLLIITAKER